MSAQFFGRSGKVLYGAFSIVGMASQPHNVNKGIPDDRVARSREKVCDLVFLNSNVGKFYKSFMTVVLAFPPLTVKNRHVRLIGHVRLIRRIRHFTIVSNFKVYMLF